MENAQRCQDICLLKSHYSCSSEGAIPQGVTQIWKRLTELLKRLGFHALAIDQAGGYILARTLDFDLFLEHYDKRRQEVLNETPGLREYKRKLKPSQETSREPKRQKTDECGFLGINGPPRTRARPPRSPPTPLERQGSINVKRRRGAVRIREQRLTFATPSGKSGPGPGTKVGTVLRVRPPAPRSSNVLKRPYIQRGVHPVSSTDANQSPGISTQRIELVVITDMEQESSEDDNN
jgi:hypothetical protein